MILDTIVEKKKEELALFKKAVSEAALLELLQDTPRRRDFGQALMQDETLQIIAEVKRASPSEGFIDQEARAGDVAMQYQIGGAAAISVLTDTCFFGGSFEDLEKIRIPKGFDYEEAQGLSNEIKEKLSTIRPSSLAQASRISGVTPAAITVLMVKLKGQG